MDFDTKAPTPKVLFSPAGKVDDDILQIIARQAKSPAAEAAIKMNVFQMDTTDDAPAQRAEVADEVQPVKVESKKPAATGEKDISDVVKKWSKK
jgi:hypothetical protein